MASEHVTPGLLDRASASSGLGAEWRRLTRAATFIAILTSPAPFFWFHVGQGWSIGWSLVATFFTVIAFRGLIDLLTRRLLPWPSLYKALAAQLSRPLESTLPKRDAITTSSMTEGELATVEALTEDNIFLSSFQQTANRQTILLLGTGNE